MTRLTRAFGLAVLSFAGMAFVVGPLTSAGQDGGPGGKEKKGKGSEEERIFKTARKAFRPDTERDKWVKEMGKHYPDSTAADAAGEIDYGRWFDALSGGRGVWQRADVPAKPVADLFDRAAGGEAEAVSREQFLAYARQNLRADSSPLWKPEDATKDPLDEADKVFRDLDRDGNGVLDAAEQSQALRDALGVVDRNRDGVIDRDEYRAYFHGRLSDYAANPYLLDAPPPKPPPTGEGAELAGQAIPARPSRSARNLYTGLPSWFRQMDTDRDGQVGLYEWRRAGRKIAEFVPLDLNADGYLAPAEFRRFVQQNPDTPYAADALPPSSGEGRGGSTRKGSVVPRTRRQGDNRRRTRWYAPNSKNQKNSEGHSSTTHRSELGRPGVCQGVPA